MRLKSLTFKPTAAFLLIACLGSLAVGKDAAQKDAPQPQAAFIKLGARTKDVVIPLRDNPAKGLVRFPVILEGAQAGEINFKVIDAVLNNQARSDMIGAFVPIMESPQPMRGPAILIEVNLAKVLEQGEYQLTIEPRKGDSKGAPLELKVAVPVATIRPPKSLIIERVLPFFWMNPEVKDSMKLEELTKGAWLSNIQIEKFEKAVDEKGMPVNGDIVFTTDNKLMDSNKTQTFDYQLAGGFPLGITKGSIDVKAPLLAATLPISFEVRSRVDSWVIFPIIAIGLIVGWLVRTCLQQRIEMNKIKLQGIELQQRIAKELQLHPDEDFKILADAASTELENALRVNDSAKLKAAITNADKALNDALADLKLRREAAQIKLEELFKLVSHRTLPETITVALKSFAARIDEANQELKKDNVKAAAQQAEAIRADLGAALKNLVHDWRKSMRDYLGDLSKDDTLLPAPLIAALKLDIPTLTLQFDEVTDVSSDSTTAEIAASLKNLDSARVNAQDRLDSLRRGLQVTLNTATAALREVPIPDQPAVERLKENLAGVIEKLGSATDHPEVALKELPEQLAAMSKAWSEALLNQIPANHAGRKAVEDLIQQRDYISAANKVAEILPKPELDEASAASTASSLALDMSIWPTRRAQGTEITFITRSERVEERRDPLVVEQARTRAELFVDSLIRNVLVALLVTIIGYLMFAAKFVGTFDDVAKVFFWAFAIDMTVEALVLSAKGLKAA